ncbi:hypothetical protein MMC24_003430 [Lignoscripta atroalba]|nr:hypothetical protein [Lignoscripta atroalba]
MKRGVHQPVSALRPAWAAVVYYLLGFSGTIRAAPTFTFPINSQVPPVARVLKAFNFTFSSTTCTTDSPPIQYRLSDAPAWLQLDNFSRTLSGAPGIRDTGPVTFDLIATDATGSASVPVTLIVSADAGPGLGTPVVDQLPSFGTFSSPNSLLLYPSNPLSIFLASSTFTNTNENTIYYALCANNTPLPSWIHFDAASLSFSGTTPGFTSPVELPQSFDLQLTASDVVGFSGAVTTFQLTIGLHKFAFSNGTQIINIHPGSPFSFEGLQKDLTLDGKHIGTTAGLKEVLAETPEWISIDAKTLVLSGTPPASVTSQSFQVTATDIYGDTAKTTIYIEVNETSKLLQRTIGILNVSIGSDFKYTFDQSLFAMPDLDIDLDLGNASFWLMFDATTLTLSGHVPIDLQPQEEHLKITATQGFQSQSQNFTIRLLEGIETGGSIQSSSTGGSPRDSTTSAVQPTTQSNPSGADSGGGLHRSLVAAAIVIPLIALLGALLLLCWYRRRKRLRRSNLEPPGSSKRQISRPILQESTPQPEMLQRSEYGHTRIRSDPPKIDVPNLWTPDTPRRHSRSRSSWKFITQPAQASKRASRQNLVRQYPSLMSTTIRPESGTLPDFSIVDEEMALLRGPEESYFPKKRQTLSKRLSGLVSVSPSRYLSGHANRHSVMSFTAHSNIFSHRVGGIGHGSGMLHNSPPKRYSRQGAHYSDMSLFSGLGHGKRSFRGQNSGPLGFGRVGKSWRNTRSDSWTTTDRTNTSTTTSRSLTRSIDPQNLNSTLGSFPRPPTGNTLGQSQHIHENAFRRERATIRTVPSPTRHESLTLQAFHKKRARYRQRQSPFLTAGPSSRKSSHSGWTRSIMSPAPLFSAQKEDEANGHCGDEEDEEEDDDDNDNDNSKSTPAQRKFRAPQRSYSASSSLHPGSLPPPLHSPKRRKYGGHVSNVLSISRFHSSISGSISRSRSSISSSRRFESAAEESEAQSGTHSEIERVDDLLEEDVDERGERKWVHAGLPNPLGWHGVIGLREGEGREAGRIQGLSWLREGGRGSGRGGVEGSGANAGEGTARGAEAEGNNARGVVVLGGRGRRPVSVENEMDARRGNPGSASLRGDLAFV